VDHAPSVDNAELQPLPLRQATRCFERTFIAAVLARNDGCIASTARALGIKRPNLYRKLRALGLNAPTPHRQRRPFSASPD
jgi:DNA-binding NtrC family response regulator